MADSQQRLGVAVGGILDGGYGARAGCYRGNGGVVRIPYTSRLCGKCLLLGRLHVAITVH
jgi:hypothetical protein